MTIEISRDGLHYLAGPYRGAVRHNIREAEKWAVQCAKHGMFFFCPHLNSAFMDDVDTYGGSDFWLEMDKRILVKCERVLLLPGWEDSKGACEEKALAERLAIPVYEIGAYLDAWDMESPRNFGEEE